MARAVWQISSGTGWWIVLSCRSSQVGWEVSSPISHSLQRHGWPAVFVQLGLENLLGWRLNKLQETSSPAQLSSGKGKVSIYSVMSHFSLCLCSLPVRAWFQLHNTPLWPRGPLLHQPEAILSQGKRSSPWSSWQPSTGPTHLCCAERLRAGHTATTGIASNRCTVQGTMNLKTLAFYLLAKQLHQ